MPKSFEQVLNKLKKNKKFEEIIEKITLGYSLNFEEKEMALSIAILFLKEFEKDRRKIGYFEFAYYIILNYSLTYQDFHPLYDISTQCGFFPISKFILEHSLIDLTIFNAITNVQLEDFNYKNQYIQTHEQAKIQKSILEDNNQEIAFIAPTSYGKSSLILDLIEKYNWKKICILTPSKSLIAQTFEAIKDKKIKQKILLHDEMYNNEENFIAIFTQERGLRFLKKENTFFEALFIDEAHNLFESSHRAILLSRFISKSFNQNKKTRVFYLSPFVNHGNNLAIHEWQNIKEKRIQFNLKEAKIYNYRKNEAYLYNRFIDSFYKLDGKYNNFFEYIQKHSLTKNFIFLVKPPQIEEFALELETKLPNVEGMDEIIQVIQENVHQDFYITKLLRKGVIYLHGQMPDTIKEYLEHKAKTMKQIKYIVANSVILEGINLPIDNMFILNMEKISKQKLLNLIGRVSRLDSIFSREGNLSKLQPPIHFLDTKYGRKKGNMQNTIRKKLKSNIFEDKIENIVLKKYDKSNLNDSQKLQLENELFLQQPHDSDYDKFKQYFLENGLDIHYRLSDTVYRTIFYKISKLDQQSKEWQESTIIDKIYIIFIKDIEKNITNLNFKRLENINTRKFYMGYVENSHRLFKDRVKSLSEYFEKKSKSRDSFEFFGSYGEVALYGNKNNEKKYINLNKYHNNFSKLINLAIVKIKNEDNFIAYTLNAFVEVMRLNKLITDEEYNLFVYGTQEKKEINFVKLGLSNSLISKLKQDKQLDNLKQNEYGNLIYNEEFRRFLTTVDDFYAFQIKKLLFEE